MATKRIEIHCLTPDGVPMIINRLSNENAEVKQDPSKLGALRVKASKMAYDWGKVYPNDKIAVVEL